MPNIFFTSDTHFGHVNLAEKFTRADGSPARNFSCVNEMDEYMVKQWNSIVRPKDIVWHLGDLVMNKSRLDIAGRLNGVKHLVMGNHEGGYTAEYMRYFESLRGVKDFKKLGFVCTHIPIHPNQLEHRWKANVQGHLHHHRVLDKNGHIDERYINVCVEHWDYKPVEISVINKIVSNL